MENIIKFLICIFAFGSSILLGIEIITLFDTLGGWIAGFVVGGGGCALTGIFIVDEDNDWGFSAFIACFISTFVWIYTLSIDVKCKVHNKILPIERNTIVYMEMLYKQAKDNDVEDANAVIDNFGEWIETLQSEKEYELVETTLKKYFDTHEYQGERLENFFEKHQDEALNLFKIL
ncbi:hypothetical protein IIW29_01190 [Candidatus Saccharibacteria bacterium]|nr:hypothetical protein [Candidatus Saccharibacteria bacterium]